MVGAAVGPLAVNCSDRRSTPKTAGTSADPGFRAGRRGGGAAMRYRDGSAGRSAQISARDICGLRRHWCPWRALARLSMWHRPATCPSLVGRRPLWASRLPLSQLGYASLARLSRHPFPAIASARAATFATRPFLGFSAATPFPPNRFRARSATSSSSSWPLSFVRSASTRVSRSEMRCLCCAIWSNIAIYKVLLGP